LREETFVVSDESPETAVAERPPLRVAFASDFHAGSTTHPRLLASACDALASCEPHIVLLGGDFVTMRASSIHELAKRLERIPAPHGKFAVLGNHDLRADRATVIEALRDAGVRVLANEHAVLPPPYHDTAICGLEDATRGHPRADHALDTPASRRIVLMHSPEGLHAIGERAFDLAFCGHTHGGQIALPWGTPVVLPPGRLNRRFHKGRFDLRREPPRESRGRRALLVSGGVGCSTIPVRLFAAPEVHLCLIM
ncbi:MAG TPA: metallophosphoesterase family protein, partial [Kofleriaceae bacterium]|nr:metallophosphoesterase family protein [Kofleriaceae bacterium]